MPHSSVLEMSRTELKMFETIPEESEDDLERECTIVEKGKRKNEYEDDERRTKFEQRTAF